MISAGARASCPRPRSWCVLEPGFQPARPASFPFWQTLMQAVGQGLGIPEGKVKERLKVEAKRKEEYMHLPQDHRGKDEAWGCQGTSQRTGKSGTMT